MICRCAAAIILAFTIGILVRSEPAFAAVPAPAGQNSITIAVDASVKGQIKAYGSYTTAQNVTLTKVEVWAFPTGGGVMPAQTATTEIDMPVKGSWAGTNGCILKTRVYKNQYMVRADGFFSDNNNVSSGYVSAQADGGIAQENALSISWDTNYPTSTVSKKISSKGSYTGTADANNQGVVVVIPDSGGKKYETLSITVPNTKKWSAGDTTVDIGGIRYSVINYAKGNDGKYYSSPSAIVQVAP